MLSTAQSIVAANGKAMDLFLIIAIILLGVLTVWNFMLKALPAALLSAAIGFVAIALLYAS